MPNAQMGLVLENRHMLIHRFLSPTPADRNVNCLSSLAHTAAESQASIRTVIVCFAGCHHQSLHPYHTMSTPRFVP
jgi:hypothetical protein